MDVTKLKALEKMLKEMKSKHTGAEDAIHNWLCDQEDKELFEGILKKDRSIKGSMQYCTTKASKIKTNNVAMIDDQTVFSWVREYFIKEKVEAGNVTAEVSTSKESKPAAKNKKSEKEEDEQLSLFDLL